MLWGYIQQSQNNDHETVYESVVYANGTPLSEKELENLVVEKDETDNKCEVM